MLKTHLQIIIWCKTFYLEKFTHSRKFHKTKGPRGYYVHLVNEPSLTQFLLWGCVGSQGARRGEPQTPRPSPPARSPAWSLSSSAPSTVPNPLPMWAPKTPR